MTDFTSTITVMDKTLVCAASTVLHLAHTALQVCLSHSGYNSFAARNPISRDLKEGTETDYCLVLL